MKPFDLEAAKRGEPIQTRDGRPVKFIAHVPEAVDSFRVVVLVEGYIVALNEDGSVHDDCNHYDDIFMAPHKRTVWVNLYKDSIARWHYTESTADSFSNVRIGGRAWPLEIEE